MEKNTLTGRRYEAKRKEVVTALNKMYAGSAKTPEEISDMANATMKRHIASVRAGIEAEHVKAAWQTVRDALSDEIHSARTRLSNLRQRQKKGGWKTEAGDPAASIAFYEKYIDSMMLVKDRVDYFRTLAVEKPDDAAKTEGLRPPTHPNAGTYAIVPHGYSWVDWLPEDTKRELRVEYAKLGTKTSDIMERDPSRKIREQHDGVRNIWVNERNALLDAIDASHVPRPHEEIQVRLIDIALTKLAAKPLTKKANKHWRVMVSRDEYAAVTREVNEEHKAREEAKTQPQASDAAVRAVEAWDDIED